ncbi:MAG: tRNA(Ile)-lysidine synthetase [Acidobacteria bacterium]|nr:tRNA(Ile)-lysidine synthetase [Acidobacteriota bacterium]
MADSHETKRTELTHLERRVLRTIAKHGMLNKGDHVLAAVSGGADSMALLVCLHHMALRFKLILTAAHLNHGIRGNEADEDENFIRHCCEQLDVPFIAETAKIKSLAGETKQNLEDLARRVRYEFLRRTAAKIGAAKIAVGHNLDDQAETILLRLLRGSGIQGLAAIHPVVDKTIIRPLLECSRTEILEFLSNEKLPFREDSSNLDLHYSRNRVRKELIPYLVKSFNPRLLQVLAREAELSRELWLYLDSQSRNAFESIRVPAANGVSLNANRLCELHPAFQKLVLRQALKECLGSLNGITLDHIRKIIGLCGPGKSGCRLELPHGYTALRQFNELKLLEIELQPAPEFKYELAIPGRCVIPQARMEIAADFGQFPGTDLPSGPPLSLAYLEAELVPNELIVRSRASGDRYGGSEHKKVKKLLIDSRIPFPERSVLPMVATRDCVLWIPGFRPAKSFRAKRGAQNCVILSAKSI